MATTEGAALDADGTGPGLLPDHEGPRDQDARAAREAAWVRALAEMEGVADRAEDLLRVARTPDVDVDVAVTEPWRTPRGLGPLPLALAPRAAALVERQRDLVRRTAEQLGEHRRRLRTSDGLRTRAAAAPVYLDIEG
ncbi:hypothetical protein [Cellulomonas sp. Marseille-Q8402]